MRTLGYLQRTQAHSIKFHQTIDTTNQLTAYADASFADSLSHRSQTGYIILLNGAPISWKSKCQTYSSLSTQEAEIVAACDCLREIQFLRDVLASWNIPNTWHTRQDGPTILYEDNTAAITYFENGNITSKNKHFATKLEHIRRLTSEERIAVLVKIHTKEQIADILTKSLANAAQSTHTDKLLARAYHRHVKTIMLTRECENRSSTYILE